MSAEHLTDSMVRALRVLADFDSPLPPALLGQSLNIRYAQGRHQKKVAASSIARALARRGLAKEVWFSLSTGETRQGWVITDEGRGVLQKMGERH